MPCYRSRNGFLSAPRLSAAPISILQNMTDSQRHLFDIAPEPWELDDAAERTVATVVLPEGPGGSYDYSVPDSLRSQVQPGRRVRVPFGRSNRVVVGYCVRVENKTTSGRPLKQVAGVVDPQSLLAPTMLRLTKWMAEYYLCPWGQVLEAVVPAGVRVQAGSREATYLSVPAEVAARITQLKLPARQAQALKHLAASPEPMTAQQLASAAKCTLGPIQALRAKGLVREQTRRVQRRDGDFDNPPAGREEAFNLNADQQAALAAIQAALHAARHETVLIHGVTGSGKTEVYIQAIEEVLSFGRQAIVLVPEISLTPQTRQRFASRFSHVAVIHSHLGDAERNWQWQRIARGEVQVVVGARSAVFAPVPHLGLVVLDEEHDASFKQDTAPRYHARDVALRRAELENVPLVLGSATPSLESWQRTKEGPWKLVEMPRRVFDRPLPHVHTIDLRAETHSRHSRGAISRPLHQAMAKTLEDGGQVILLLNRRGFSTHIQCPACGKVMMCPECDIALTHHREGENAVCHYCDYRTLAPPGCPECHFDGLRYSGLGTQRLEAEVRSRFPGVSCLRMDSDSMRKPGSHEAALARFRNGDVQVLLGTQMIAKGLDFPNVTLVGVVNADTALHLPDFRAAERTFQLVTQVAGRTGRGDRGGHVLVQTFSPEHPAIQAAVRHDYAMFAEPELAARREYEYPPFSALVRFVVRGSEAQSSDAFAQHLGERLREASATRELAVRVLGPTAAPIARLRGKYRFHLLAQAADGDSLREVARETAAGLKPPEDVQWIVDVDPLDML
jgi:primosomal protein N' (replication factor Y)